MDDPESTGFIIAYVSAFVLTWLFVRAERTLALRSQSALERLLDEARPWGYAILARATTKRRIVLALGIGGLAAELVLVVAAFRIADLNSSEMAVSTLAAYALAVVATLLPLAWYHFVLPVRKVAEDIPQQRVRMAAPILMLWTFICWPLVWPVDRLLLHFARQPEAREAREEALLAHVEDDSDEGIIEADQREMISSIMNIGATTVKEVMVPRVDIEAIERDSTVADLFALFAKTQHSRIPIYDGRLDNIIGIVHAKDALQLMLGDQAEDVGNRSVDIFAKESSLLFVPTSKKIDELLGELRRDKKHMAVAVDEYGGTAGVVTMEDILEEIVGEIQDEYDEEEETPFRWLDEHRLEIDASMDIADVNELVGGNLPDEDGYETLGGFLYHMFSAVPEPGAQTTHGRLRLVVRSVSMQRIDKVLVERLDAESDVADGRS